VQGLQSLGWAEGHAVRIDFRFGAGDGKRLRTYAAELVGLAPDVILGETTQVLSALREATRTVPIVFVNVADPVSAGFVPSLSKPSGNITGFAGFEYATSGKWLELLKEIAPDVTRVAVIFHDRQAPNSAGRLPIIEALAPSLKLELTTADVRNEAEIARTVEVLTREANGGVMVLPSSFTVVHRNLFIALTAQHRLPAVYPFRYFADAGGLISYGIDTLTSIGVQRLMSIASSGARGRPTCRFSGPPSMSW
jgi:putative ABC transport system substrate-binding protein